MSSLALIASLGLACFAGEVRVQVRDAAGEPIPNAEVRWFAEPAPRFDFERIDELAHASGNVARSNEAGQLVLDVASAVTVVGSAPTLWGCGSTDGDAAEFELTLVEDRDLVVITVDESGQPVGGVPVAMIRSVGRFWQSPRDEKFWSATTVSNTGLAVFRHASYAFHGFRPQRAFFDDSYDWYVGLDSRPLLAGSMRWIGDTVPTTPVTLRTVPLTDVEVRISEGGTPLDSGQIFIAEYDDSMATRMDSLLAWGPLTESETRETLLETWLDEERREHPPRCLFGPESSVVDRESARPLIDGVAKIERLVPGARLSFGYMRNAASDPIWVPFQVPEPSDSGAAQLTVIELESVSPRAWTTLVVRPTVDGRPVGRGALHVGRIFNEALYFLPAPSFLSKAVGDSVALDESGSLIVNLRTDLQLTTELGVLWSDDHGEREAWIDTSALAGGRTDLGDLEFAPRASALAGFLLDDAGRPVAGAKLEASLSERNPFLLPVDSDGSFDFRSNRKRAIDLFASAPGYAPVSLPAVPHGTTDLRVVLSRPVRVSGSLALGPLVSIEGLSILLLRVEAGESIDTAPGFSRSCRCAGLFEFEDVRPGRYTLLVRRAGERGKPIELFRRELITIPPGTEFDLGEVRVD